MITIVRRKKFNKKKFYNMILCTLALIIIMPVITQSVASGGTVIKYQTIVVENGDNLWNIARDYTSKGKDIRNTIEKIKDFNQMNTSSLTPGQKIKIPSNL